MTNQYKIRFSKARQCRGLKAWAVFEIVDPQFSRAVSSHDTEAEASAAKTILEEHHETDG
jgi:hypothetical protein